MKHLLSCIAICILLAGCGPATATPTDAPVDQSVFSGATATPKASPMSQVTPSQPGGAVIAVGQTTGNQQPSSQPNVPAETNPVPAQQSVQQPPSAPPTQASAPTQAPAQSAAPTQTPTPASAAALTPTPTPRPSSMPDGAPYNPWGYDFEQGKTISSPPDAFCNYFNCINNFASGKGYVMECKDHMYSKSGGVRGSCSKHEGNNKTLYSH